MRGSKAKQLRRIATNNLHPSDEQPRGLEPRRNKQGKPIRGTMYPVTHVVGVNPDGTPIEKVIPFEITPTLVNRGLSHRGLYRWLKREVA